MAVEKLLPQNVEAEADVLGSLLIDPEAIVQIADFLRPDDFYHEAHRTIYQAALELFESHEPADLTILCDELARRGKLDEVGGASYVSSLANQVPTSRNVKHYAQIVERTAILRRLINAAGQIAGVAYSEPDADAALEQAERFIYDVGQRAIRSDFDSLGAILRDYIDKLDQLHERRGAVVGVGTGFADLDKLTSGLQKSDLIILAARPSVGKCLTAHTLIDDPVTGARLTIEECVRRQLPRVFGMSSDGCVRVTAVTDWIDSGVQPVYRVRTRTGRCVEVTGHHPFLTVTGWVPLHDLSVGSTIAVPCVVPAFGSDESWPIELVRLLAYLIARGGLTERSPEFIATDPELIADFKTIIAQHFPACAIRQDRTTYSVAQPRPTGLRSTPVRRPNPLTTWLKELGLWGKLAKDKRVPACAWTWSRRYLVEFLRVLMSCGGSIYPVAGSSRIEFSVASSELADDVHHLLLRFGIIATREVTSHGAHRIEITSSDAVRRYQEEIGWIGERSQRLVGVSLEPPKRFSNVGHPPVETWELVRVAVKQRSLPLIELARQAGESMGTSKYADYNAPARQSLPRQRLATSAQVLDDPRLAALASPDLYWDPITAIEPFGEQQVYDLTVPDGENFIAQDIIVHNTALSLSLAHNAALRYHHGIAIFSLEMSKEQLAARLLSMDARVDQQRLRNGYLDDDEWERISESVGRLADTQIYIDDTPGITLAEMRSKARRLMLDRGFDLLVVDYLQLMQGSGGAVRGHENRVQEISEISRGLKMLARELNVPVLALSQLSRAVESRTDKHPQLSDLRESGCLAAETPVYLPDEGIYRPIGELEGQSGFRVLALNTQTWKLEPALVTRAFATGHKPVYRLTTRLGRTVRATANHKFLTIAGWRRLDELTPGQRLALPRTLPGPEQARATMRDEELALLGHLIGDGCTLPRHVVQYTTAEKELGELVMDLATRVFGNAVAPRMQRDIVGRRAWHQVFLPMTAHATHGVRNPVGEWLRKFNIYGLRSHEKRVPEQVFAQPAAGIARFLRHLWATDGCIHLSRGKVDTVKVYYATSCPELAHDVQSLLLRVSINAVIHRYPQVGKGRDQYHVQVSGKPDVLQFLQRIGALGKRKVVHATAILEYYKGREGKTNRDVLPREVWDREIIPAMAATGTSRVRLQLGMKWKASAGNVVGQSLSRERAARIADMLELRSLSQLAASDIYWDEIVSIEPDGETDVYDLTVANLHNLVAGDITLHNSIEQDSDIVLFIYRDEVYNPDTDRKNIADIIVAKHRNGPIGTVPLYFQAAQTRFRDLDLRTADEYE